MSEFRGPPYLVSFAAADARTKIANEIIDCFGKNIGKYIEAIFRYFGLMSLLVFMKVFSWSKMLFGGFLSLVGACYPIEKNSEKDKGTAEIKKNNFSLIFKGSLKFVLVIAGAVLIVSSIFDGVQIAQEETEKGYIGIKFICDPMKGLTIANVIENTPAAEAGLLKDDKIIKVNNILVPKDINNDLALLMLKGKVGSIVILEINRNGLLYNISILRASKLNN